MDSKRCTKCGEIKPLDAFVKDKRRPSGRSARCKKCINFIIQQKRNNPIIPALVPGQRYNMLTVIERMKGGFGKFLCDCGNIRIGRYSPVKTGAVKSCGCFRHGLARTPAYNSWSAMLARCCRPHKHYGARGISVCDQWKRNFPQFLADMGPRPDGMSLDRWPNVNGNYEPGNCRWATVKEQNRNKRNNTMVSIEEETRCLSEWCEILDVQQHTIVNMVNQGRAISTHDAFASIITKRLEEALS